MRMLPIAMFLVGLLGSAQNICGKGMKSADYFESKPQRSLAEAAAEGRIRDIDEILLSGADINFQGREGMTALIWAFIHENRSGYEHLLEKGANPNLAMTRSVLTSDGITDGNSATSLAAMHEDPWFLKVTLSHRGDPNVTNQVKGLTPIFQCIQLLDRSRPRDRLEQLRALISAGANVNEQNRDGYTPMMQAAIANRYDMVHILLDAGADPELKTRSGVTLAWLIRKIRTDPQSELYQWRSKVIARLEAKGIEVEKK